ncbi:3-hydroxybenzoate 6-hydroxylase 1 [Grifola frondosa]|uniref:3-hydroxybenzoate 6-hydroxylase 1 n=1 Tax=Grifola frondosa TaxID=5627 RepID=A0A1C7LQA7_GRIFR|nr:3-hydroxybenzoate 6-hydroxylase 1 [Grifola frondosa]
MFSKSTGKSRSRDMLHTSEVVTHQTVSTPAQRPMAVAPGSRVECGAAYSLFTRARLVRAYLRGWQVASTNGIGRRSFPRRGVHTTGDGPCQTLSRPSHLQKTIPLARKAYFPPSSWTTSSLPAIMRAPDFLPIDFVVIGGGIAGLTSALALTRVGHKVTVLDDGTYDYTPLAGGCRISPNTTKIYYRWGLEEKLKKVAIKSEGVLYAQSMQIDSGSFIGSHDWEEEFLNETGGDFLLMHYSDLRIVLHDAAAEHGADLRSLSRVVSVNVDPERPSVTLESGEVLYADVLIGADGISGVCRPTVMRDAQQEDPLVFTDMMLYSVVIPDTVEIPDQDTAIHMKQTGKVLTWIGEDYGMMGFPLGGTPEFGLFVYAPCPGNCTIEKLEVGRARLKEVLKDCEPRLQALADLASSVASVPMYEKPHLNDWVHPNGRLLVIGEAAHPLPPGSLYALNMAAGDAAALGRIFAHLHRKNQIKSFLNAVQEIRQKRIEVVQKTANGNIFAVSLPPGIAEARDKSLRAKAAAGVKALGTSSTYLEMQKVVEDIFAYDPEDEADDWWIQWGLTQERATRVVTKGEAAININVSEDLERLSL